MTRKPLWLAAIVVLVSNAMALGFAWMNRAGEPEAVLELTEREARLLPRDSDSTAITLRLAWVDPSGAPGAARWFDAAKLASVGFDCTAPLTDENFRFYRGQAPRAAYAAFEFEGESWQRYLASITSESGRQWAERGSHLVLVDAGLDPGRLRALHPNRRQVLIAHATVGLAFEAEPGKAPVIYGRVNSAYPIDLTVPPRLRDEIAAARPAPVPPFDPRERWRGTPLPDAPRYEVTVKWGRSLEPWIDSLRPDPTTPSGKN